jgi:hypothetical protein
MSAIFIVQLTQWIQISVLDIRQPLTRAEHWHNPAEKSPRANFRALEDYSVGVSSPIHFQRNKYIFLKILQIIMTLEHQLILGAGTLMRSEHTWLVKKFPMLYGTKRLIIMFTAAQHTYIHTYSQINPLMPYHRIYLRLI